MTPPRTYLLAVLTAALVFGCSGHEPTAPSRDLAHNHLLWLGRGLRSYDFEYTYANEWFAPKHWRIAVRDGALAGATDLDTGTPLSPAERAALPTVDSLFARAQRYQSDPEAVVTLEFDPEWHYPRVVNVDRPNWADDAEFHAAAGLVAR